MKIQSLAPNQTQVCLSNGTIVFVSYSTPVAAFIPGRGCVKTAHFWSRTTSKHVNAWCVSQTSTPAGTEPQAFFDGLYANSGAPAPSFSATVTFASADDLRYFNQYVAKAKEQDGTVGDMWAGLACSALKRSTIA